MAIKHQLQQSIYHILKHNRDGSYETQSARRSILFQAANDLVHGGYKLRHMHGLKQKHILFLNQLWQKIISALQQSKIVMLIYVGYVKN